ncbi:(Fe-S)-binding protein [Chloroflexota bacterium]
MAKKFLQPLQIYRLLPRTNCKLCGRPTCYAFAFDLISRDKKPGDCPELLKEEYGDSYRVLTDLIGEGERVPGTDHVLDKSKCTGCGDCVVVCNKSLTTITVGGRLSTREQVPPVLQVIDGSLQVVNYSSCKRTNKALDICNVCADRCPFGAMELVKSEADDDDEF